ncbi:MAG: HEAT repeat domain-containing protein [Deltaproteobacteria bacterium]|nr:HEAT repeat domain-containing protein [Deltaproteobacteria bacterium]
MRSTLITLAGLLVLAVPPSRALAQEKPAPARGLSPADLAKLTEALRGEPPRPFKVRLQAALILGRSGGAEALDALSECLVDDAEYPVRAACAMALGNSADIRAIEPLVAHLEDPEELVRTEARRALFRFASPEAVAYLQAARERGSARVRLVLVELAAQIKDPQAGVLLAELMGDSDEKVREQAAAVLKTMDSATVNGLLLRALEHPNYRVKSQAALHLGERKLVQAVERLVDLASSPLEAVEVQLAARAALREMKSSLDVNRLAAQARDVAADRKQRTRALIQLSTVGGPDALQACLDVLADSESAMRGLAAQALAEMGDPRALQPLREAAAKADNERLAKILQISIRRLERGSPQ